VAPNDAVNVQQLEDSTKMLSRGIASMAAMANIPQVDVGKVIAVGMGVGTYNGVSGIAVGASVRLGTNGMAKLSIGSGTSGKAVAGAGMAFSW
jgi:autotransporter adhesin